MTGSKTTIKSYASVNGTDIYYEISGSGPPLILIHGGLMATQMWRTQVGPLSDHFKVIVYDLRGHGKTLAGEAPFSFVNDLRDLMSHLGLKLAYLMGLSLGASIVRSFAILYPERVNAFVLVSAGGRGMDDIMITEDENKRWSRAFQAASNGDYERAAELTLREWVDGVNHTARPEVRREFKDIFRSTWPSLINLPPNDWPANQTLQDLSQVQASALIVVGKHDQDIIHRVGKVMASYLLNGKMVVIDGGAHHINMDQPVEFNHHVIDFLRQVIASA